MSFYWFHLPGKQLHHCGKQSGWISVHLETNLDGFQYNVSEYNTIDEDGDTSNPDTASDSIAIDLICQEYGEQASVTDIIID